MGLPHFAQDRGRAPVLTTLDLSVTHSLFVANTGQSYYLPGSYFV